MHDTHAHYNISGSVALSGTSVPVGVGQIWLENSICSGNEGRLIDCPASTLGASNGDHSLDVGVRCGKLL